MTIQRALVTAVFAFCALIPAAAAATAGITLAEYRQQLAELEQKLELVTGHPEEAAPVLTTLPDIVDVSTGSGEVTINYQHLKNDLAAFAKGDAQKRPELLRQMQSYVQSLAREAAAYEKSDIDGAAAERNLKEVLARREFRKVHGQDPRERLLAKIYYWLARLLNKVGRPGKATYNVIQVLVWIFIAGVVLALLLWTAKRLWHREEESGAREIIPFAPSARNWRSWLAEARESAARQDWRNAIHLAYWAGISFLESGGAWKPNRARTPREYLRLLSSRNPRHPALSALTRKFEIVWYGHRSAVEEDFRETLGRLEELGCR
ncbi:MAG TPA: DUF4129 domain-containing protein [Candidatus Angelobacter sp.]